MQGSIVLLDRRTAFGRDRTWCLWAVRPHLFAGLESHRWSAWEVVTPAGAARHAGASHPYVHLDSRDVYAHALARIEADPATELHLGVDVRAVRPPAVATDAGEFAASRIYDARAPAPSRPGAPAPAPFSQAFLGWDAEVDRPLFDPAVATLMDFRVPQDGGLRFLYVLPFSPTRALVEDTTVQAGDGPPAERRRALLDGWLRARGARSWTVHHEERASIPLGGAVAPPVAGVQPVGTAAGAVRPSSGYAFVRIQRHCRAVARAAAAGRPAPPRAGSARVAVMDRIFLQALADDPPAFPERFRAMVAATSPDAFARFMADEATPADELRVIAALPKLPFLAAAVRSARG